ncbi:hypothetical protein GYH30_006274 [Glycine max]|nr:hypothetical protein GYH30_006274 [Glycine max]
MVVEVMSMATVELTNASSWWHEIDDSPAWQDRISYTLVVLYGIVATVALVSLRRVLFQFQIRVQLAWIQLRVVFHLINILVNGVRCVVFIFYQNVQRLKLEIVQHILLDMSSLAFFTTYALLVLF